jgi:chemotaxis protein methyltransferase CheR
MPQITNSHGSERGDTAAGSSDRLQRRDFDRLAAFVHRYSGIKMPPGKLTMLEGRLRRRVREVGAVDITDYCRFLFEEDGLQGEAVALIDAVTTNKTEFFREPQHFDLLARTVLPELLAQGRPILKLWSSACSTGAEPYTLAMVLAELRRQVATAPRVQILATDLSTEVLEVAVRGIYPASAADPVPAALRARYVLRSRDAAQALVRIVPELRAQVKFGRMNLMAATYPVDRDLDIVFCRNVLIYFDKPTQRAVLQRLCQHLRPGGFMFLGHSESLTGLDLPLRPVGNTVFRSIPT